MKSFSEVFKHDSSQFRFLWHLQKVLPQNCLSILLMHWSVFSCKLVLVVVPVIFFVLNQVFQAPSFFSNYFVRSDSNTVDPWRLMKHVIVTLWCSYVKVKYCLKQSTRRLGRIRMAAWAEKPPERLNSGCRHASLLRCLKGRYLYRGRHSAPSVPAEPRALSGFGRDFGFFLPC